ncbi:MAG: hypothetical protein DWQ09_01715 [Proteobacteria bacterium]|nr:MAG: hypothetical protein DWQ09_01715 [Pseudomonadota bacterium]QKK10295.1 MAG: hypothetical protein HND59_00390 [Pseudomonadota bacterium]
MSNKMEPENLTPRDLDKAGKLDEVKAWLKNDFDRSRDAESQAINEFEKTLWLANSAAATITIGFLTSNDTPTIYQFYGSFSFVLAIVLLLLMKLVAEFNASRDRYRRQDHSDKFYTENRPLSFISGIGDFLFKLLNIAYKGLKYSSAFLFVLGCSFTLAGVYPSIETHN